MQDRPTLLRRKKPRSGPDRSALYLAWIRRLHCAVCKRPGTGAVANEAAHTHALGSPGMSQKTSDYSAIPLCFQHHRGNGDSYHHLGERAFAIRHGLDLPALVRTLNEIYGHRPDPGREDAR